MEIRSVKYVENGYFRVLYSNFNTEIIQDITAIKMQSPTDKHVKDILLFLRRIKLEKLADKDFDELKYRDYEVVADNIRQEQLRRMGQLLSSQISKTHYTSLDMASDGLDDFLGKL